MDTTFESGMGIKETIDAITNPNNSIQIIPDYKEKGSVVSQTATKNVLTDGKGQFVVIKDIYKKEDGCGYTVNIGPEDDVAAEFCLKYKFTKTDQGCTVRRIATDYRQFQKYYLPVAPFLSYWILP